VFSCRFKRDLKIANCGVDPGKADAAVYKQIAMWADAPEVACLVCDLDAIGNFPRWPDSDATPDTINLARFQRLFVFPPPLLEEIDKDHPQDQGGASIVDGRQPLPTPVMDRVLVLPEELSNFLHRVISMTLHKPMVGVATAHAGTRFFNAHRDERTVDRQANLGNTGPRYRPMQPAPISCPPKSLAINSANAMVDLFATVPTDGGDCVGVQVG